MPSPVTGRISPSAAVISRPLLVLLPMLTFLVPSLFLAFITQPVHTSEARLLVGGFDVQAQAVPGFVEASRTLASTYARLVSTPAIVKPVADALGAPASEVSGHISATSVPDSSIIRVEGTADNERDATRFADAAATALKEYASGGAVDADSVLAEYQQAATADAAAQASLVQIKAAVAASPAPSEALRTQQAEAQAAADAAKLQADTVAERYRALQQRSGTSSSIELVAPAAYVGSDRRSTLQLAAVTAIGLGLVVGVALATLVVNQPIRQPPSRFDTTVRQDP
jgi:capsular polysaccharide biosynthesis protein